MILYRTIYHAKMGKVDELVALIKEFIASSDGDLVRAVQPRILTDISGPFFTAVIETTHESFAAIEHFRKTIFTQPEYYELNARVVELIDSGENEYYTIEQ
ncbi:MAG: hypothetical protein U0521_12850 [Anaerolineae bacterium]